ncbi:MAG: cytochrome C [Epsilonproteobacteria bacterium]|jgi:hypothetical protein|nr:cytochrome C [Campylobacterota bacterium]
MKRGSKFAIYAILTLIFSSNIAMADVAKGQKIYVKKMKSKCAITGSEFAGRHSQDQWEEIYDAGRLKEEIKKICHGYNIGNQDLPHIYDFAYEYANDSGKIPNF